MKLDNQATRLATRELARIESRACWKLGYRKRRPAERIAKRTGNRAYHCIHCGMWHLTSRSTQEAGMMGMREAA